MSNIYFYSDYEEWISFCLYLQSLKLNLYSYGGDKLQFDKLFSSFSSGEWYVLVPENIKPVVDEYGQIDQTPDTIPFHLSNCNDLILPNVLVFNNGKYINDYFKNIKRYFSLNYKKTDTGFEYISDRCLENWLQYKINLAVLVKFESVQCDCEKFSFKEFVRFFKNEGYIIYNPYQSNKEPFSYTEDYYIITVQELKDANQNGIVIRKQKQKGKFIYKFIMDYRHVYNNNKTILDLFNEIQSFCNFTKTGDSSLYPG